MVTKLCAGLSIIAVVFLIGYRAADRSGEIRSLKEDLAMADDQLTDALTTCRKVGR
ncbi:hypothetical protein ACSVBT_07150 [Afipia sp. TerB]